MLHSADVEWKEGRVEVSVRTYRPMRDFENGFWVYKMWLEYRIEMMPPDAVGLFYTPLESFPFHARHDERSCAVDGNLYLTSWRAPLRKKIGMGPGWYLYDISMLNQGMINTNHGDLYLVFRVRGGTYLNTTESRIVRLPLVEGRRSYVFLDGAR